MQLNDLPPSPVAGLRVIELTAAHEARLQRFLDANPPYFLTVFGEPAGPDEASEEIHGLPPPGWPYGRKYLLGYVNTNGDIVAMANVVTDFLAPSVWHLGFFIVATERHGQGDAHTIHRELAEWAASHGACWLRLGVMQGNVRAARFWERLGYLQTRTRDGVVMGKLTHTMRVMVKPLAGGTVEQYLALVPRDRPEPAHGV